MKFGVNINPSKPVVQEIESVAKWGIDFVEVYVEPPFNTPEMLIKKAPLIRKVLQNHNLSAIGHAPPWCDLGSPDITVRAAWLIEMKRIIKAAAKLGLQRIDVHAHSAGTGLFMSEIQEIVMQNFVESFGFLVETARQHGIIIGVENTWESPKEITPLVSKVKDLHATLDIGHAFMLGGMPMLKTFAMMKQVDHLHVHDSTRSQEHLSFGEGAIPFKQFAEILKNRNYDSTAAMEIFGPKIGVKQSLEKFKELMK